VDPATFLPSARSRTGIRRRERGAAPRQASREYVSLSRPHCSPESIQKSPKIPRCSVLDVLNYEGALFLRA